MLEHWLRDVSADGLPEGIFDLRNAADRRRLRPRREAVERAGVSRPGQPRPRVHVLPAPLAVTHPVWGEREPSLAGCSRSSSLGLFETSEQAEESGKLALKWIEDEHFSTVIPSAPTITSGKVVARGNGVTAS